MIHHGPCLRVLRTLEPDTFGSVVTDPPYGTGAFEWDRAVPSVATWREVLRVSRPGAALASFGHPRTFHRLVTNLERGGWRILDTLMWLRAGCPRPHSLGRALERAGDPDWESWRPWKTDLLPAYEPIVVAVKPSAHSIAETARRYGTGGLHVGRRTDATEPYPSNVMADVEVHETMGSPRYVVARRADTSEHPTAKPLDVMRWLVRLTRSHGGHAVLDPFAGSGTTGVACALEGLPFVGIERDAHHVEVARRRLAA